MTDAGAQPEAAPRVCVCFVCDDHFLPGTVVLLHSLLRNEPCATGYDFLAFHDGALSSLSEQSKEVIRSVCPRVGFVEVARPEYRQFPAEPCSARISLLKYECFKIEGYEVIMYLDTDMLVVAPLAPLVSTFLESGLPISGVENKSRSRDFRRYAFVSFPMNAGMFLLRGGAGSEMYDALLREVKRKGSAGVPQQMVCQPILNDVLAAAGWEYLAAPCAYNFRDLKDSVRMREQAAILHFVTRTTTRGKPWLTNPAPELQESAGVWQSYAAEAAGNSHLARRLLRPGTTHEN